MIICNTRNLLSHKTGVQRYTEEVLSRLPDVDCIRPNYKLSPIGGHLWEQVYLPIRLANKLLWSPSNTGPIFYQNQVVTIHDLAPLDHPEWCSKAFSKLYRFIIPRLAKNVKKIITDSHFSKNRLISYIPEIESKLHVIPLAADERFAPVDRETIEAMIFQLNLPTKNYVLAVGSLEPRKNINTILKMWDAFKYNFPDDIWLVLVGAKGNSRIFAHEEFRHIPPRVCFTGHLLDQHLPALYSGAIASIYVPLYEGFGLPPLEAMSCGIPVICSSTSSLPEVVGENAILVNPLDVGEIGRALTNLIFDSSFRLKIAKLGLDRAKEFSWNRTAQRTWSILLEAQNQ